MRAVAGRLVLLALLALLAPACGGPAAEIESPSEAELAPITDGAAFLAQLEARLRSARAIAFHAAITSRGVHATTFEGTVSMEGADIAWQLVGAFGGGDPVTVELRADANHMHGGAGPARFDQATPPELRDALAAGLVRMGLLHDCALLVGGEAPDMRSTRASDWVVLEDVTVGDATLIESEFAIPIHAHLRVAGEPMGEATLWIDEARRVPVRRDQTVIFPEGEMHVVERYGSFEIRD